MHNRQWLHYSSHDSPEGRKMKEVCEQRVKKPTRNGHLLDLVVTDMVGVTAMVLPSIADHKLILAELNFTVPERSMVERTVWKYEQADWERMRDMLANVC